MGVIHNRKMEDSLITKIQLFLFSKAFEDDFKINEYFEVNKIDEIKIQFHEFKITNELANLYSSKYYQYSEEEKIEYNENIKEIKEIINILLKEKKNILSKSNLKKLELFKELKKEYKDKFLNKDFDNLLKQNECSYCGITIENIKKLGEKGKINNKRSETRGYTLEIDRKLPNFEYTSENCCMSCYWCNNAKTDEFSPKEFKPIARGINEMWNRRLRSIEDKYSIKFDENSDIWEVDFDTKMEGI
ncbi:hypothetical protein [Aliarcobacter butzleri]|uniref:hypothetical protein n=1 Tax=Aliarcobacter butzleri TaxID=28197 RepID=UPI0021B32634|nr:hypothetical protein [Aliarcobacter butzleri]MCT7555445.1 hypothetical protein [Aliarcobacter butzleri]